MSAENAKSIYRFEGRTRSEAEEAAREVFPEGYRTVEYYREPRALADGSAQVEWHILVVRGEEPPGAEERTRVGAAATHARRAYRSVPGHAETDVSTLHSRGGDEPDVHAPSGASIREAHRAGGRGERMVPAGPGAALMRESIENLAAEVERRGHRMEECFSELRRLLFYQAQGGPPRVEERWLEDFTRLVDRGYPIDAARTLIEECASHSDAPFEAGARRAFVADMLATRLTVALPPDDTAREVRVVAFVGPPGQGKTTVIRKAALAYVRQGAPIAFMDVNLDNHHPHSVSKISASGFGAPHRVLASLGEARAVMQPRDGQSPPPGGWWDARAPQVVLVDTAADFSNGVADGVARLAQILTCLRVTETYLVLGADYAEAAARRAMEDFAPLRANRWVLTRMDLHASYGLLAMTPETSLSGGWAYCSSGASPSSMWRRAVAGELAALLMGECDLRRL